MNKEQFLVLAFGIFLLQSCSPDESIPIQDNLLLNTWHMQQISGGIAGINEQFDTDELTWTFLDNDSIEVQNNVHPDSSKYLFCLFDSGTYSYTFTDTSGVQSLVIDQYHFNISDLTDTLLDLDNGAVADGFYYRLVK